MKCTRCGMEYIEEVLQFCDNCEAAYCNNCANEALKCDDFRGQFCEECEASAEYDEYAVKQAKKMWEGEIEGDTLYDAVTNRSNEYASQKAWDENVDKEVDYYMGKDNDDEWASTFENTLIKNLIFSNYDKYRKYPIEKIKKLAAYKKEFNIKFKNEDERREWAYERAQESVDCWWQDLSKNSEDEDIACFFGISPEPVAYWDGNEWVDAKVLKQKMFISKI